MLHLRCWPYVTSLAKNCINFNIRRFGHSQSKAEVQTSSKFSFNPVVKFVNKRHYDIERVVNIQMDPDNSQEPIFLFPGFEGRVNCVLPLIENIGRNTFCLQQPFEGTPARTSESAQIFLPHLEKCIDSGQRVNIVAHSFGGLIAFDVIKLLESKGRTVRLCLIDSSPYALKIFGQNTFGDVHSADFEANMVIFFLNSLEVKNIGQFSDVIESTLTFAEKIEILAPTLTHLCQLDVEQIKLFCQGLFNVVRTILIYDANFVKFESQAALIRPYIRIWGYPDDYKMADYFKKPVPTYFTDGHHVSMLKSKNTAALVNKIFEQH